MGWHPEASEGEDAYDWVAPPSRFSTLSLRARTASASGGRKQTLARDVRPPANQGQSIPLTLHSQSGDPVSLRVRGLDVVGNHQVQLVNQATGRSYDLRQDSTPRLQTSSDATSLTLLIGPDSFVRDKANELTTTDLQLQPGGPNPFREQTTLTYTLPKSGNVTLEVFDVLGRRVRVLVDESKEAGTYNAIWEGADDGGRRVASGVYLGRLTFEGQTLTQKLVLVK